MTSYKFKLMMTLWVDAVNVTLTYSLMTWYITISRHKCVLEDVIEERCRTLFFLFP